MEKRNWFRRHPILTIIIALLILGFINAVISGDKGIGNNAPTPTKSSQKPTIKIKSKSSPVPTDPCADMVGTSNYAPCEDSLAPTEPPLKATVQTSDQYLIVTNNSNVNWTDCYVSIDSDIYPNDFYQQDPSSGSSIPAGGTYDFAWGNIVKLDGTRFNFANIEPNDIIVGCDYGKDDQGIWTNYK